jgi:signal recognition particle GTPase
MMHEVAAIRMRVDPTEVILIADAMTGQDAMRGHSTPERWRRYAVCLSDHTGASKPSR